MKKFLFAILIVLISCDKGISMIGSPIKQITCVLNSYSFFDSIAQVIESFIKKDLSKIISSIFSLYQNAKEEFNKCLSITDNNSETEKEVNLKYERVVLTLYAIIGETAFTWYEQGGLSHLKTNCISKYGQTTWFCLLIPKQ